VAAYALSQVPELQPVSQNGVRDWGTSLDRQLEFYTWLQSAEGGIAGGATNSYNGSYDAYPAGTSTFYGMAYDDHPVYHDPGSNQWFGMQAWSMERVAELYYISNDVRAKNLMDKWVAWVKSEVHLFEDGGFEIPATLQWTGAPETWVPESPVENTNLHVTVSDYGQDLGIAGCLAKALIYYAAATREYETLDTEAQLLAKEILDRMWNLYYDVDGKGVAAPEPRGDYTRFFEQEIYIPDGWTGVMANGDVIEPGVSFIDIRSGYRDDPDFPALEAAYNAGEDYEAKYHRFWAQADIALANAEYGRLFESDPTEPVDVTGVSVSPETDEVNLGGTTQLTAAIEPINATDKSVVWSSSDESIAIVSTSGLVTGEAEGTATITATTNDGGFTATSEITVVDIPVEIFNLTTSVVGEGSVSADPAGGTYADGTEVTLTATAATGYEFVSWSGDASGTAATTTITMDADKSVVATFQVIPDTDCDNPVSINMPFQTNGAGTWCYVSTGTIEYINSWNMDEVRVDGEDYTNAYAGSLGTGTHEIYLVASVPWAHFEVVGTSTGEPVYYSLSTSAVGQGSVSPADGSFEEGTVVSLVASPATGYEFTGWSGDASGSDLSTSVTMDGDKNVTATFTEIIDPEDYTLSVTIVGQGTVEPNGGTFTEGTVVDLVATPASGYEFTGWSGDASGTATSTSVTMDANKSVTATFTEIIEPEYYILSTSVTGSGSVSPESGEYVEGTVVSLTATPATGYVFESWSGDASGTSATTSITMDSDKAVVANFIEDTPPEDCDNPVSISIPFVQNGAGEYCWVTTTEIAYINSWNLDELTINGVDYTNTWSNNLPAANASGEWVIHYVGPFGWSHFEAPAAKAADGFTVEDIEVYPNPFSDELNVNLGAVENVNRVELLNSLGQVIYVLEEDQIASESITISVDEGGSMFILRVHTAHDVYVKSVVKK
jgi:uncharacterized repeat protein (TIGR02543 family)